MNIVQRILRKVYRTTAGPLNLTKMKKMGMQFLAPNYVYFGGLDGSSVIVDVGCGYEAEFSRHLIEKYNLEAFGVDPTRKHAPFLKELEESSRGRFHHLAIAVSQQNGYIEFHESKQNESGSILLEHTNVENDEISTYSVESVHLRELVRRIGRSSVDMIKLDLEGAEYELLGGVTPEDLAAFKQIFVEFHHHCTNHSTAETKRLVRRICGMGFQVFTLDQDNYLFYR